MTPRPFGLYRDPESSEIAGEYPSLGEALLQAPSLGSEIIQNGVVYAREKNGLWALTHPTPLPPPCSVPPGGPLGPRVIPLGGPNHTPEAPPSQSRPPQTRCNSHFLGEPPFDPPWASTPPCSVLRAPLQEGPYPLLEVAEELRVHEDDPLWAL
jgi:hypothetical protein